MIPTATLDAATAAFGALKSAVDVYAVADDPGPASSASRALRALRDVVADDGWVRPEQAAAAVAAALAFTEDDLAALRAHAEAGRRDQVARQAASDAHWAGVAAQKVAAQEAADLARRVRAAESDILRRAVAAEPVPGGEWRGPRPAPETLPDGRRVVAVRQWDAGTRWDSESPDGRRVGGERQEAAGWAWVLVDPADADGGTS